MKKNEEIVIRVSNDGFKYFYFTRSAIMGVVNEKMAAGSLISSKTTVTAAILTKLPTLGAASIDA